jgi:hypothetical protein
MDGLPCSQLSSTLSKTPNSEILSIPCLQLSLKALHSLIAYRIDFFIVFLTISPQIGTIGQTIEREEFHK